jgi:MSHA biogenesis protein MshE
VLGRLLVAMGAVSEEQVAQAMAKQLDLPFVDLRRFDVHPDTVRLLSEPQARRHSAVVLKTAATRTWSVSSTPATCATRICLPRC